MAAQTPPDLTQDAWSRIAPLFQAQLAAMLGQQATPDIYGYPGRGGAPGGIGDQPGGVMVPGNAGHQGMVDQAYQQLQDAITQLHARSQAAQGSADQAGQAYQSAAQAPLPSQSPGQMATSLFGNLATAVSKNPQYQEGAQNRLSGERASMMEQRSQQLQGLHDEYQRRAEIAQNLGQLDVSLEFQTKANRANATLEQLHKMLESQRDAAVKLGVAGTIAGGRLMGSEAQAGSRVTSAGIMAGAHDLSTVAGKVMDLVMAGVLDPESGRAIIAKAAGTPATGGTVQGGAGGGNALRGASGDNSGASTPQTFAPPWIGAAVDSISPGHFVIDLGKVPPGKGNAAAAARYGVAQGYKVVKGADADNLRDIKVARQNLVDQQGEFLKLLPPDWQSRVAQSPGIKLKQLLQSNGTLGAWKAWNDSWIGFLRASVGSKAMRMSQPQIDNLWKNNAININDVASTGLKKFQIAGRLLDNRENGLGGWRGGTFPTVGDMHSGAVGDSTAPSADPLGILPR